MSYRDVMGFVNLLYCIRIPRRDGRPLGGTEFSNMQAAFDALPADLKTRLDGMTASHGYEKFWEHMRLDKHDGRPPFTDEQRRARPPVSHPLFLTHPISGRKVLYCNPGYTIRINELPPDESERMLAAAVRSPTGDAVPAHASLDRERSGHLGSYRHDPSRDRRLRPDEIRLMRRCQIMANKVFDPAFLRIARAAALGRTHA